MRILLDLPVTEEMVDRDTRPTAHRKLRSICNSSVVLAVTIMALLAQGFVCVFFFFLILILCLHDKIRSADARYERPTLLLDAAARCNDRSNDCSREMKDTTIRRHAQLVTAG
jgi:hypothetical protein